jgi:hypothetical protein
MVMLPWYLRPVEPSRIVPPWFWHSLPSVLVLACFVSFVVFLGTPPPDAFAEPQFLFTPLVVWASVASGLVRRRRSGGRGFRFSIPGLTLIATSMTVLVIPAVLWPGWPDREPPTGVVASTTLLCWWSAGALLAVGLYLFVSDLYRAPQR